MPLEVLKLEVPTDLDPELPTDSPTRHRHRDGGARAEAAPRRAEPLDQLKKLPVPLWFIGVVAGSLFLIFGTFGIYVASSAYSAASSLSKANVETAIAPPPIVAAVAPAPVQEIPQDILEAEAAKDEAPRWRRRWRTDRSRCAANRRAR
jgi:hypothetical protein